MPLTNPVTVSIPSESSTTGTITTVASTATSTVIIAANANRKDLKVYNSSTARLYLAFAATASLTAFTVLLEAGGFYEFGIPYTGLVSGIWATANGNALITELS